MEHNPKSATESLHPEAGTSDQLPTPLVQEKDDFPIVGIGSSAGGLEPLKAFFEQLPEDDPAAYVIVLHLSPDYKSLMAEILEKSTSKTVYKIEDGMKLERQGVYVMPARNNLSIKDGRLYLVGKDPLLNVNFPIDLFFQALGEDQMERAIGIVLSGSGSDGSRGIKHIKGNGGIVMVQDPITAKFDGMPRMAIRTGLVDYVLSASDMAQKITSLISHQKNIQNAASREVSEAEVIAKILHQVLRKTGMDFTLYKSHTINRRITRRMNLIGKLKLSDYYVYLAEQKEEAIRLKKELLIGVTKFFRDEAAFKSLEDRVIPELFKDKKEGDLVRIWVTGCSTGEEVYSLMILCEEYRRRHELKVSCKIFGTDADEHAIDVASKGLYDENTMVDVPLELRNRYFLDEEEYYLIHPDIRNQIVFARHNIFEDPPFNKMDMIVCRNLLIYLKAETQRSVLTTFHFSLNPKGFLFLGPSETVGEFAPSFNTIDNKWRIYQQGVNRFNKALLPQAAHIKDKRRGQHSRRAKETKLRKRNSVDTFKDVLLEEFGPMSAFTNARGEVLYLAGGINKYMQLPNRSVSLDIQRLLPEKLGSIISTALRKVVKVKEPARYEKVSFPYYDEEITVDVKVKPVNVEGITETVYMISLAESTESEALRPRQAESGDLENAYAAAKERIALLEQQLADTQESLHATIEAHDNSNEELQATNEELMSSNEELQSTNEELQSVNEELHTVNEELQAKIEELSMLTNDMDNLLKSTDIGTVFLDKNLRIRKFTPAIKKQFHLLEQDINRPIEHFNAYFESGDLIEKSREVLRTREPFQKEIRTWGGGVFLMRILPYMKKDEEPEGVVMTFVDINEVRKTDFIALMESKYLFEVFMDKNPILAWVKDAAGTYTYVNTTFQEVHGLKEGAIDSLTDRELYFDEALLEELARHEQEVLNKEATVEVIETRRISQDKVAQFKTLRFPLHDAKNQLCVGGVAVDITDQQEAEQNLLRTMSELEATNQRLEEFAYVATHDLRAPALNLKRLVEFLDLERIEDEETRALLSRIGDSIHQLSSTLHDLVELVALNKSMAEERESISFASMLENIRGSIGDLIAASGANIVTDFEACPEIRYPRTHLHSILLNLLTNAIKYRSPDRDLRISIHCEEEEGFVKLVVADNGLGIDMERHAEKLFGMYKRFHSGINGKGLGLYIVKSQVEALGGKITVDSAPDKGSTFSVYLKDQNEGM